MTEVIMPKMGDGMEEGTLVEWTKKDGDEVKSGEIIGSIQTDKATLDLEAPGSGKLSGILIQAGDTVPVGEPIAAILKSGEALPAGWGGNAKGKPKKDEARKAKEETRKQKPEAEVKEPAPEEKDDRKEPEASKTDAKEERGPEEKPSEKGEPNGRIKASPLAKRLAKEAGVELRGMEGSGPGGRIVAEDVRAAIDEGPKVSTFQPGAAAAEDKKIPLNNLRRIIAERTAESKQAAPHFYVTVEVDVEKIEALRSFFKEEESGKVSVNDFVIRACTLALRDMPVVNSTFQGDHLLQFGSVHIGVAVAVDDGLLVPVIKNAHAMTLRQIADESRRLVEKARAGKLTPNEMSGSTFSISNMGMLNVDEFSAIINQPNAAIVAVSTAKRRVVPVSDDEVEVRMMMNVTGSFDHRVVDGAQGAQFMNVLRDYLENPTRLLS